MNDIFFMVVLIFMNMLSEECVEIVLVGFYSVFFVLCVEILLCLFGIVGNFFIIVVICKSKLF